MKFGTFYEIRKRADTLAQKGFLSLIEAISDGLRTRHIRINSITMIGHSFGARILAKGFEPELTVAELETELRTFGRTYRLLPSRSLTIIMLDAAIDDAWLDHLLRGIGNWVFKLHAVSVVPPSVFIFNIYSTNDWANRLLFPIGAFFTTDKIDSAIGARPVGSFQILRVNRSGEIDTTELEPNPLRLWNVDASLVVSSHTDIYKGRVVNLI